MWHVWETDSYIQGSDDDDDDNDDDNNNNKCKQHTRKT